MSRKAKFTDAGEGLILKYILDCRVALAPRNDTQIVCLSTNPNIYPRNYGTLEGKPTSSSVEQAPQLLCK